MISEDDRRRVFTVNGIIRATVLVDGMVSGMWCQQDGDLRVRLFREVDRNSKSELASEGRRLLSFLHDGMAGGAVAID